jgi:hypothetical protein
MPTTAPIRGTAKRAGTSDIPTTGVSTGAAVVSIAGQTACCKSSGTKSAVFGVLQKWTRYGEFLLLKRALITLLEILQKWTRRLKKFSLFQGVKDHFVALAKEDQMDLGTQCRYRVGQKEAGCD